MSAELRVAALSDVHGNLVALRTVLRDIERHGPFDRLIVAGDHCLNGPDPAAAFDLIREQATDVLKGNTDRDIVERGASDIDLGGKKGDSIAWTRERLGDERIAALDGLAFDVRVEPASGDALYVVHANPHDLDRHLFPDAPEREIHELVGDIDAGVLAFGHLHIPYRRRLGQLELVDVASCGLPRDGDRRAVWAAFAWSAKHGWCGEIRRTEYDVSAAALRMRQSCMPHADKRIHDLLRASYD